MKVLQVNAVNALSSTGRTVSELAAGLETRGIESRVAYSAGPAPKHGYLIGTQLEKKLHALRSRLSGRQAYFSKRATRGLLRYIEAESPDVVHLRNLHANYINLPMLLSFLGERDIPTVVNLDDCWYFTGKCCHYTIDGCYRWETGCGSCPRLRKDNPSWFIDASAEMWADKKRLFESIPRWVSSVYPTGLRQRPSARICQARRSCGASTTGWTWMSSGRHRCTRHGNVWDFLYVEL